MLDVFLASQVFTSLMCLISSKVAVDVFVTPAYKYCTGESSFLLILKCDDGLATPVFCPVLDLFISALKMLYFVAVLCWFSLVSVLKWTPSFLISLCRLDLSVVLECEVNGSIESMGCICLHVKFLDPFIWMCFLRIVNVEFIEVVTLFTSVVAYRKSFDLVIRSIFPLCFAFENTLSTFNVYCFLTGLNSEVYQCFSILLLLVIYKCFFRSIFFSLAKSSMLKHCTSEASLLNFLISLFVISYFQWASFF